MKKALEFRNYLLESNPEFYNKIKYGINNDFIRDFGEEEINIFGSLSNVVVNGDVNKAFEEGYNIGRCRFFAQTLSYGFENCSIVNGILPILKGTAGSPNGGHVWLEVNDQIYDTTLLIVINKQYSNVLAYFEKDRLDDMVIQNSDIYKCRKKRYFDLLLNKKLK